MANGKPAPDIFLKAAELLGVAPEKCLVIEDAAPGVIAAQAAGMQVVTVPMPMLINTTFSRCQSGFSVMRSTGSSSSR